MARSHRFFGDFVVGSSNETFVKLNVDDESPKLQITTAILFSYTLYVMMQGWYRHYHTMHYHANRTEDGFGSGISENTAEFPGNGYQYGTSSAQPTNSAEGFGQMYDPNYSVIMHALSTESPLTELFRSNVSRASSLKYFVTPNPSVMSASASNLAKKGGFGKLGPPWPKVMDRDE